MTQEGPTRIKSNEGMLYHTQSPSDSLDTAGSSSILPGGKPVDRTRLEKEVEERLLRKLEEAQNEPNPAKSDGDATWTTLEEQTGKNMDRRTKTSNRHSESGKKDFDIRKGPYCEDESREKIAQRILRQQKGRYDASANALTRLDLTPHFVPEKMGGL